MKDIFKNGVVVLLIIAVLYIIFLRECKRPAPCPAEDEIIIKKSIWDSINKIANEEPITHIDTVYIKGDIVYIPVTTVPVPIDNDSDTINYHYADSLIKEDINVWYRFKSTGILLERQWAYRPIETVIHRIDSIPYPVYVKEEIELLIPQRGLYLYGIGGGNANAFIYGGGLDYITKRNTEVGYMYQRLGNDAFHSFKLGVKLFNKNK